MKQKVEMERYCPECGSYNLTYRFYESALGMRGNDFVCGRCGFGWSID